MPSTFAQAVNNLYTTLAADHVIGDGQLVFAVGTGDRLGPLPANRVWRCTALANANTASEIVLGIFEATGVTGDTLTGVTATEGFADVNLATGTVVQFRWTAKEGNDWSVAINAAETAIEEIETDSTIVRTTGSYANPDWITDLAGSKVTGDITGNAATATTAITIAGSIAQGQVNGLPAALAAKADDDAVVKLTGDQEIAGSKTLTGTLRHDIASTNAIVSTVTPVDATEGSAPPIVFTNAVSSNPMTGGNLLDNAVMSLGWNVDGAGTWINPAWPTFRIGLESNFWTGHEQWMEGHLFAFLPPGDSGEIRPFSVVVNKSNNYDTYAIFQGSSWVWANPGQTLQIASLARDAAENVKWTVPGKGNQDGTDGYSLQLSSGASPISDVLTLGRNTTAGSTFVLNSSSQTAINLNAGAGRALIGAGATILTIQAPAAGGFLQERSDNYQLLNYDASRFIIRAGDNGTAAQIGFLGASPVSRQLGEITTGLVNLGLFSSVTIAQSSVTNLVSDLDAKAPLASPALTGTPTAPTASPGTNNTQVATTAYVDSAVAAGGGASLAFVATASQTVANTTMETTLFGTGVGSLTVAANALTVGKTYRLKLLGNVSAVSGGYTIKLKLGGVTLFDTTNLSSGVSNVQVIEIDAIVTCVATGATATVMGSLVSKQFAFGSVRAGAGGATPFTVANVDTTIANAFDVTWKMSTAATGNTITITNAIVEALN